MLGAILVLAGRQAKKTTTPAHRDLRLMLAKSDFDRYLDILLRTGRGSVQSQAIQLKRVAHLKLLRSRMEIS